MPTPDSNDVLLRADQVSRMLGMSTQFVLAHSKKNNPRSPIIPATMIGGRYRYELSDVLEFIAAYGIKHQK